MKTIVCNFNLFDLHQNVYLINPEENVNRHIAITNLEDLGKVIAEMCTNNNATKIHLYGNASFAQAIIRDIDIHSGSAYSKNIIEVEVN